MMLNRMVWAAGLAAFAGLLLQPALATELGTAGPFRSFGGDFCASHDPKTVDADCRLPVVDTSAPASRQATTQIDRALRFIDILRMEDARAALTNAIRLDPTNLRARTLRARLSITEGRPGEAETDLDAALALAPHDAVLLASRAFLERSPDNQLQGFADATAALNLKPDDADIRLIRSTFFAQLRKDSLAFDDLSYALALDPSYEQARRSRAEIALRLQNYDAAVLDAGVVLATSRADPMALDLRAQGYIGLGDDTAALKDLDKALQVGGPQHLALLTIPQFREMAIRRGLVLVRLKRNDDANAAMTELIGQGGQQGILRMQVYLRANGFPNVEITGKRSDSFDVALLACFADKSCGPRIKP